MLDWTGLIFGAIICGVAILAVLGYLYYHSRVQARRSHTSHHAEAGQEHRAAPDANPATLPLPSSPSSSTLPSSSSPPPFVTAPSSPGLDPSQDMDAIELQPMPILAPIPTQEPPTPRLSIPQPPPTYSRHPRQEEEFTWALSTSERLPAYTFVRSRM
jgi:hypothetical protein